MFFFLFRLSGNGVSFLMMMKFHSPFSCIINYISNRPTFKRKNSYLLIENSILIWLQFPKKVPSLIQMSLEVIHGQLYQSMIMWVSCFFFALLYSPIAFLLFRLMRLFHVNNYELKSQSTVLDISTKYIVVLYFMLIQFKVNNFYNATACMHIRSQPVAAMRLDTLLVFGWAFDDKCTKHNVSMFLKADDTFN